MEKPVYHISVYMIIISVHVSDDHILFVQAPLMFMFYSTKTRQLLDLGKMSPLWLIAGLVLLNANITLQIWLIHLVRSDRTRE